MHMGCARDHHMLRRVAIEHIGCLDRLYLCEELGGGDGVHLVPISIHLGEEPSELIREHVLASRFVGDGLSVNGVVRVRGRGQTAGGAGTPPCTRVSVAGGLECQVDEVVLLGEVVRLDFGVLLNGVLKEGGAVTDPEEGDGLVAEEVVPDRSGKPVVLIRTDEDEVLQ